MSDERPHRGWIIRRYVIRQLPPDLLQVTDGVERHSFGPNEHGAAYRFRDGLNKAYSLHGRLQGLWIAVLMTWYQHRLTALFLAPFFILLACSQWFAAAGYVAGAAITVVAKMNRW